MRTIPIKIVQPDGQPLGAWTPIATLLYSDAVPESRPYRAAVVEANGELVLRIDGPDPVAGTGMNVQVLAVKDCASWIGRGVVTENEWVPDVAASPAGAFTPDGAIQLRAGSNPFA